MTPTRGRGQDRSYLHGVRRVALALVALLLCGAIATARAAEACAPVLGRMVSIQGSVELRRAAADWKAAQVDAVLCAGDTVRVNQRSRAALLLDNNTTLRLDQHTTLTLSPPRDASTTFLELIRGGLHVITRTPRPFRVNTPYVNAGVEGTEFSVRVVDAGATISVVEGRVLAVNDAGTVALGSGETASAATGTAPSKSIVVRPLDAVAWAVHFPTLFDYRLDDAAPGATPLDEARRRSIGLYRRGDLPGALAALDGVADAAADPRLLTYRAGLLLLVGRLDEAKPAIDRALQVDPGNSDAHALLAIVAVVENDKDRAMALADKAVQLDAASPRARIALSYAQQARFEIERALASVEQAVALDPRSALAHARRAELEISTGNLGGALAAAQQASRLDPDLARTQTVLGFAHLVRIDTQAARAAFERAIVLDSADPLPRLGLGLAKIRDGELEAGRVEIEVAAILDPRNSLVRSYLGKAYYEEKRDPLTGSQFELAKALDPKDPTPWFYDAIRKQTSNRPVEALRDLNRSIALNDNRAVYRSRLLLDDDRAARTTSLAAIYGELGFERLAIVESVKALADNPGNGAAHQQLARAYADLPRHDIARVSEALQAQIRQPLTLSPIDPELGTDNLGILRGTGPSRLGTNEFNQLFARDQVRLQVDGIVGSRGTVGDQIVVSGLSGRLAYAASQLHYETDGFRQNNDATKNAVDAFVQGQLTPAASLQLNLRRSDFELGTTFSPFDPLVVLAQKIKERSDVARFSGHFAVDTRSDWVFSVASEHRDRRVENFPDGSLATENRARTHSAALQRLASIGSVQLTTGAEALRERDFFPLEQIDIAADSQTLYAYGQWRVDPGRLSVLAGLALEHVQIRNSFVPDRIERKRASPKLGLVWSPQPETTVRAAAFSAVKRPFIRSQTLEPTQVAGFNQFFTGFDAFYGDIDGTISRRVGVAIDQRLSTDRFAGAEVAVRHLDVPTLVPPRDSRWKERSAHLYLYDARLAQPSGSTGWGVASSLDYGYERVVRPQTLPGPEGIVHVSTHHLPVGIRLFRGPFVLRTSATYVKQSGIFSASEFTDRFPKSSRGWIADVAAEYRLPARTGTMVVGIRNAFDKSLDLFQIDPLNPRDAVGRFVYAKLRLVF